MNQSTGDWDDPDDMKMVLPVLTMLHWSEVVIVTERHLSQDSTEQLSDRGIQHVLVSGSEALSGDWIRDMVRTGVDSWRPLHLLIMCSLTCVTSALTQASQLERNLGTLTAVGMTSRWLVMTTASEHLLDHLNVTNVNMDNIAVLTVANGKHLSLAHNTSGSWESVSTLLWKPYGRIWANIGKLSHARCRQDLDTITYRTSDHHGDLEQWLFPNLQRGYNGRHLKVLTKEWINYVISRQRRGRKEWSGLYLDLLQVASDTLNFTYSIVEPTEDEWGSGTESDPDTGFFGHVIRKEVDLGLAPTTFLLERSRMMDFPAPVYFSAVVMVYRKPLIQHSMWLVFGPLSTWLLFTLLCALVGTALLLFLLQVLAEAFEARHGSVSVHDPRKSMPFEELSDASAGSDCRPDLDHPMSSFASDACNTVKCSEVVSCNEDAVQHCSKETESCWTRLHKLTLAFEVALSALLSKPSALAFHFRPVSVLLCSWWMLSLVVAASYGGTLTAFLSVSKQPLPFSSLDDLVTQQHDYKWGTIPSGSIAFNLQNSNNTVYQQIWSGMQRFQGEGHNVMTNDMEQLLQRVTQEDLIVLTYDKNARQLSGRCDVEVAEIGMDNTFSSPVLPKQSALRQPLSDVILQLHANGLIWRWTDQWFPRASCPLASPGPVVITMLHVQGLLLTLPVGVGLALFVLGLERLHVRWKKDVH